MAADLDKALRTFGLTSFRPGQREVVETILAGRPTVAVMPTGAGKSLCYQLPATLLDGLTLVVSPLLALMRDQIDALTARGIAATSVTSELEPAARFRREQEIAQGRYRIVYMAPERLRSPRFVEAVAHAGVALLAVDEAHCISHWGYDFRPEYLRLGGLVERVAPPRIAALTATATPDVRRDIAARLQMTDPAVFVRGFDRPNLHFAVEHVAAREDKVTRVEEHCRTLDGAPAIVYVATRKNAETLATALSRRGRRALAYHAGLSDDVRGTVQDAFMAGRVQVVVATNAFGMGIDKANVRLVLHADLPRSIEAYYQEAGRAGRDGSAARCVLLYSNPDRKLQEFLIDGSHPGIDLLRAVWKAVRQRPALGADTASLKRTLGTLAPSEMAVESALRLLARHGYLVEDVPGEYHAIVPEADEGPAPIDPAMLTARASAEHGRLNAMVTYSLMRTCRRRALLDYFGDEEGPLECGSCDACQGTILVIAAPDKPPRPRRRKATSVETRRR